MNNTNETVYTTRATALLSRLAKQNPNAYECLEQVCYTASGRSEIAMAEAVAEDLARLTRGEVSADALLAECLDGAEDADVIAGWTDYVSALASEVG